MSEALIIPVGLTEKQYIAQLARMESATVRASRKFENDFKRSNSQVVKGFNNANRAASGFARGGMRQVGLQLSQVSQQGMATGNWVQALAIQLPDLALGFGTVGIAAGALGGMLLPMAFNLATNSDAAEDLEESLKALDTAMSRLNEVQARAGMSATDLSEQYGALASSARRVFEIEREIAALKAGEALKATTRGIAGGLGVGSAIGIDPADIGRLSDAIRELREEQDELQRTGARGTDAQLLAANQRIAAIQEEIEALRNVRRGVDELQDMLGITEEEAGQVAQRFAELGQIEGAEAQARAMQELVGFIWDVTGNLAEADEEGEELYDRLVEATRQGFAFAAVEMAGNVGEAADEAERLNRALARYIALNPASPAMTDEDAAMSVPVLQTSATREANRRAAENIQSILDKEAKTGGRGASAASKRENDLLRERDRILRDIETATERYGREVAELDKVKQAGLLTDEQYNRALGELNEQLINAEFGEVIKGIEDVSDAIANAIVNGEDLGETFSNVLKQIAADIISSNIRNLLMSQLNVGRPSGGGGGLFGFVGNLIGGLFGRAGGGQVMAGTPYRVNEGISSEVFAPAVNGRILSVQQAQEAMGGRGGPIRIALDVATSKDLIVEARQAGGAAGANAGAQVALTVTKVQGNAMAGAVGAQQRRTG